MKSVSVGFLNGHISNGGEKSVVIASECMLCICALDKMNYQK